jgi:hypothetical protein
MAKDTKSQADKVKKDHAATGKPVSATEDPTDHSKPADEIAAQVDPQGKSGAAVNAASIEAVDKKDEDKPEEDNTIAGKILRSGLFFVRDHTTGEDYVGVSPQNDPDASDASKRLSSVTPLGVIAPRTGMIVRPKGGPAFTIPDGFGPDATPALWATVVNPETGDLLFA